MNQGRKHSLSRPYFGNEDALSQVEAFLRKDVPFNSVGGHSSSFTKTKIIHWLSLGSQEQVNRTF